MIMLTGVAVLGLLAGTLASFFRLQPGGSDTAGKPPQEDPLTAVGSSPPAPTELIGTVPGMEQLLNELSDLRAQMASLSADLGRGGPNDA